MIDSSIVSWATFTPILPEILLVCVGFVVLGLDLFGGRQRNLLPWVTVLGGLAVLVMVAGQGYASVMDGMIITDSYSQFFKVICLIALIMAALMSEHCRRTHGDEQQGEYYFLLIFSAVGMMIMASAGDLIMLYLGLELMAISAYCLVGMRKSERRSSEAAIKYFLMGGFASAILLYGMALVYGLTGTTSIAVIAEITSTGALLHNPALLAALGLMIVAFCFKVAIAPFHFWVPDVYEGAPTAVTAFMSVAAKAAGFAIFGRVVHAFPYLHDHWGALLAVLALLTMAIGNITALAQTSIKRMLAYSAIAHAGYALLGLLAGTAEGLSATMSYLLIYGFMNMGAFAILVLLSSRDANRESLDDYRGLAHANPLAAILMLIFMFSLIGIPPLAGFIGKFYLLKAALAAGYTKTVVGAVIFSAISAYFYLRVVRYMYMSEAREEHKLSYSPGLSVVLGLAVLGVIGIGLFPEIIMGRAVGALLGQ